MARLVFRLHTQVSRTIGTSVAQRQNTSDFALFQAIDRQKDGQRQTYGTNKCTSRHTDRRELGQKRSKTDKTETETRGRRQQTRIRRQDGRQRRCCGIVCTATRAAVMVGGWLCCCSCCVHVSLLLGPFEWWPPPLSSLEVAVCPLLP